MALTNTYRNKVVDSLTGRSSLLINNNTSGTATVYIGLSSTPPTADGGNITEPSAEAGYSRTLIGKSGSNYTDTLCFPAAAGGEATNDKYIYFTEALQPWGTLNYFVLFSSATGTGSNVIGYAPLTDKAGKASPITVSAANTVVLFRPGDLTIRYVDAAGA